MLDVKVKPLNVAEVTKYIQKYPEVIEKARVAAIKGLGFWLKKEIEDYIKSGGAGSWAPLHPLTKKFRKSLSKIAREGGITGKAKKTPLFWLSRFVRYMVDKEGKKVMLTLDTRKGGKLQYGSLDPRIQGLLATHEKETKVDVDIEVRRAWARTRKYTTKKKPKVGKDYFALRKGTAQLTIPKREIFNPVYVKTKGRIYDVFEEKFRYKLIQYTRG